MHTTHGILLSIHHTNAWIHYNSTKSGLPPLYAHYIPLYPGYTLLCKSPFLIQNNMVIYIYMLSCSWETRCGSFALRLIGNMNTHSSEPLPPNNQIYRYVYAGMYIYYINYILAEFKIWLCVKMHENAVFFSPKWLVQKEYDHQSEKMRGSSPRLASLGNASMSLGFSALEDEGPQWSPNGSGFTQPNCILC